MCLKVCNKSNAQEILIQNILLHTFRHLISVFKTKFVFFVFYLTINI